MRWFTSVSVSAGVVGFAWAPAAYGCPLCFGSSAPGVLRAYLVSAFFMIGLAWAVIGGLWLYVARMYSQKTEAVDTGTYLQRRRGRFKLLARARLAPTQTSRSSGTQENLKG